MEKGVHAKPQKALGFMGMPACRSDCHIPGSPSFYPHGQMRPLVSGRNHRVRRLSQG